MDSDCTSHINLQTLVKEFRNVSEIKKKKKIKLVNISNKYFNISTNDTKFMYLSLYTEQCMVTYLLTTNFSLIKYKMPTMLNWKLTVARTHEHQHAYLKIKKNVYTGRLTPSVLSPKKFLN